MALIPSTRVAFRCRKEASGQSRRNIRSVDLLGESSAIFVIGQYSVDLTQAVSMDQLAKQHPNKLPPICKSTSVTLCFGFFNHLLEFKLIKKLEKLTENNAKSIRG